MTDEDQLNKVIRVFLLRNKTTWW